MQEKGLNLHSIFRIVIPGYVFLLVIYSFYIFCPVINLNVEKLNIPLVVLLGLPIGFLLYALNSISLSKAIELTNQKVIKNICGGEKDNGEKNIFSSIAFSNIFFDEKEINEHVNFLHSRTHAYGVALYAVLRNLLCREPTQDEILGKVDIPKVLSDRHNK